MEEQNRTKLVPWKRCNFCPSSTSSSQTQLFKSPREFAQHLRDFHCTKEGGSFVCRYGANRVCPSLPVEGVSDRDYEDHVARDHVSAFSAMSTTDGVTSTGSNSSSQSDRSSRSSPENVPISQPSVVEDQHKWTIYHSRVNLPAALNDPRLAKRETDIFTKTWGESFERVKILPSPYLPEVNRGTFERYIQKTSGRYKKHLKNAVCADPQSANQNDSLPTKAFPALLHHKQLDKSCDDLDQVPKLFLQPNFSLENVETFNTVFPWTQVETSKPAQQGNKRQSSKLLQEKLSHYLDIVEVQIARQVSCKSEAFFHAMTSHDDLNNHMLQTCAAIKHLRDKIHALDSILVEGSLKVMKIARMRSNAAKFYNKLKLMATVHQTQPTIQLLLSTSEFVGALDLISTTQEVLTLELAGVTCFRHLGPQLAEMEKVIDKMMQADFAGNASKELNRDLAEGAEIMEEDRLVSILFGLLRQRKFYFVDTYREEACTAAKAVIKQTVIEAVSVADDIDTDSNAGSLADQMRLLNFPQWMEMLTKVFENVIILLQRVKAFQDVTLDVLNVAAGKSKTTGSSQDKDAETTHIHHLPVDNDMDEMISVYEHTKVSNAMKDMMGQVCDHAHDRCVKLLTARAKDNFLERLSSSEFVVLSRAVEAFVCDCEKFCGRRSTSLRGSLQSQANRFATRFHEERKNKLSLILDSERWKQADVPYEFQELVDHIAETGKLELPEKRNDSDKKPAEVLIVGEEQYAVVGTVLLLLKMVVEYCQCVDDIPSAAPDILTRLIELLKMFNSRTCQLVLGAGAVQLVGLRTISTKNLALASRCLQLVIHHIPLVKNHFEERLLGKQQNMMKYFDQILKDYKDHIQEVSNKIVIIMSNILEAHLSKWEVKAPVPSQCFRTMSKQMNKMHENISDVMPESEIRALFLRINQAFVRNAKNQLKKLNISNDAGPQHGLVTGELAFYIESFKGVPGMEDLNETLIENIWNKR